LIVAFRNNHRLLSREKHVSNVSATCFHHLRRLRHVWRSLISESATMLVHAFVTSRVDYCNVVFTGAPNIITNTLERVLNSAARVVSGTRKFDRSLRQLMHTELHWLDVPERVKYKLGVITCRCLYGSATWYLAVCFVPVSTTASRQHLRSAAGHQLVIPSHRLTTYGRRAFSVAGPMFWNLLPRNLRDPSHTAAVFGRSLKTFFSQSTSVHRASEAFATMCYINRCFTYLLTLCSFNIHKFARLQDDR